MLGGSFGGPEPPGLLGFPLSEGPDGPPPPVPFRLGFRTPLTMEGGGGGGAPEAETGTGAADAVDEVAVDAGVKAGADADIGAEADAVEGVEVDADRGTDAREGHEVAWLLKAATR